MRKLSTGSYIIIGLLLDHEISARRLQVGDPNGYCRQLRQPNASVCVTRIYVPKRETVCENIANVRPLLGNSRDRLKKLLLPFSRLHSTLCPFWSHTLSL